MRPGKAVRNDVEAPLSKTNSSQGTYQSNRDVKEDDGDQNSPEKTSTTQGFSRIRKIQMKKLRHKWSSKLMKELVELDTYYKAFVDGEILPNVDQSQGPDLSERFKAPDTDQRTTEGLDSDQKNPYQSESPLLTAARMGVTEMVKRILNKYPMAIHDVDSNRKNALLLAAENRQPDVYRLLIVYLGKYLLQNRIYRDKDGNTAAHLAAKLGDQRPWPVSSAALQMQLEYRWYKFVKGSSPSKGFMTSDYFDRRNVKGQTTKDVFTETHRTLVQEASDSITKIAESCSVVAALIAGVAFTASTTVPGGIEQSTGREGVPVFEGVSAYSVFAFASLIALCFSVISLLLFLSVITSRRHERDFAKDLPLKLLFGLTGLFVSIAAMLTSFCAGHGFIIKETLRPFAYPIYAATGLLVIVIFFFGLPLYINLISTTFLASALYRR